MVAVGVVVWVCLIHTSVHERMWDMGHSMSDCCEHYQGFILVSVLCSAREMRRVSTKKNLNRISTHIRWESTLQTKMHEKQGEVSQSR